jgi:hypothetical protein
MTKLVFHALGSDLPSITRFYTYLPHLCKQLLGILTHQCLPRMAEHVYGGQAVGVDDDSYHGHVNKSKQKAITFLCSEESGATSVAMLMKAAYCKVLNDLSLGLQEADHAGGGLKMLLDRRPCGSLFKSMKQLWGVWAYWRNEKDGSVVRAALWLADRRQVPRSQVIDDSRKVALSFGAALERLRLKYHIHPFFRWLSAAYVDPDVQITEDEAFFDTPLCCRDHNLSKPFLGQLECKKDLQKIEIRGVRAALNNLLKATNMVLEAELAEARASLPRGKSCGSAEMQCYLPYLDRVLKEHLSRGQSHPCELAKPSELASVGVPMEQHPKPRWSRPDRSALNFVENPQWPKPMRPRGMADGLHSDSCEEDDAIDDGLAAWRLQIGQSFADEDPELPEAEEYENDMFCAGDDKMPVRVSVVKQHIYGQARTGQCCDGLRNKASGLRVAARGSMIVRDCGAVKDSHVFEVRLSCPELHPGLCFHRHHGIYHDALQFAASLERCLQEKFLYQYLLVKEVDGLRGMFFYLARRRRRSPNMQITHLLARVRHSPDAKAYVMQEGMNGLPWNFVTVWSIAAAILIAGWGATEVHLMSWDNNDDGSVVLHVVPVDSFAIWPDVFRVPRQPRDDDGPELLDDIPQRKKQSRKGGVKVLGPGASVMLLPDDAEDSAIDDEDPADVPPAPPAPLAAPAPAPYPPSHPVAPAMHPGAPPPPLDPPPPALAPLLRARPGEFSLLWGGFRISRVRDAGVQVGWGMICCRGHVDESQPVEKQRKNPCKIQITYGNGHAPLSDDDCILRLKRWAHVEVNSTNREWRSKHTGIRPRTLVNGLSERELDQLIAAPGG